MKPVYKKREPQEGDVSIDGGKTWLPETRARLTLLAAELLLKANPDALELAKHSDGKEAFGAALRELWGDDSYRRKVRSAYVRAHKQLEKENGR